MFTEKLEKVCFDNSILLFAIGEKPYYEFFEELKYEPIYSLNNIGENE